jgi:hypothetical protein
MLDHYTNTHHQKHQKVLHTHETDTYLYENKVVKIITVFTDSKNPIALVEDEQGEIFEVPKDSLK